MTKANSLFRSINRLLLVVLFLLVVSYSYSQNPVIERDTTQARDSIKTNTLLTHLGNGYFPTKYFNFDLRYLVKYNQYEALRTGLGGVTNENFSEKFKLTTYLVYGFRDHRFKYHLGGAARLNKATDTWIEVSYTDDLQETGSTVHLTDGRLFQFFEPRLLNIELFYKHITQAVSITHRFDSQLSTEAQFSVSNITPTFNYVFQHENTSLRHFHLSMATVSLDWRPFSTAGELMAYPTFALQIGQSINGLLKNELGFTKVDFKSLYIYPHQNRSSTQLAFTLGMVSSATPLTHMYHAYPNNNTKETILQRFTVAGLTSFETMYFNEFFSDRLLTLQGKHAFAPFELGSRFKPELVLISKFALGHMKHPEYHQGISFNTLEKGYFESGFELNKLLFGFGLSAAYRYGSYHLPKLEDNIALKFTFNITL